ncbi:MAG: WD40-repeat-containing domain protein [Benniella sp.]|nr:MAG: WD40-repeat-containing domain protein [Benniella sp.]
MSTRGEFYGGNVNVVYSPRGDQLAFGNLFPTVGIWNILTGDCEHILRGHDSVVTGVAYSPQGDQIASASWDTTVKLWDVKTGDCLHTLTGHTDHVNCIAYSPNGNQIASGSVDGTVRLWNVKTGKCRDILPDYEDVRVVVYSPRGDHVASIDYHVDECGLSVQLRNVATKCYHFNAPADHTNRCSAYSPRGDQLAFSDQSDVLLWDVETGKCLHTLSGHSEDVSVIVYSPHGDLVASAAAYRDTTPDTTVRLWNAETGVCLWILAGHLNCVQSVVFSPKGDQIISGSLDKTVRIWDVGVRTSKRTSSGHTEMVRMVKCSPKGGQVASCSKDMTVRLWDVETGSCRHIIRGHNKDVRCIAYSPQGDQIATGSEDTTVRLWDTETGRCTHTITGHSDAVTGVVYSPQGNRLVSCCYNGTVRLWNVRSGECLHTLCENISGFYGAVLSPNGSQVATKSKDTIYLYNTATGRRRTLKGHKNMITSIVYSSHGDLVVSASTDETVRLWDAVSGRCQAVIQEFQHEVNDVAWVKTTNAQYVVAGCENGVVGMWQVTMNEERFQVRLHWKTTNGMFDVKDVTIQDVKGLDSLNKRILKQSGAAGEPDHRQREGIKEEAPVAPVVSRFKNPSDWVAAEVIIELLNLRAKRPLDLDEEDEGVAKRTRGNEKVSSMEE